MAPPSWRGFPRPSTRPTGSMRDGRSSTGSKACRKETCVGAGSSTRSLPIGSSNGAPPPPLLPAVDAAAGLATRRPVDEILARVQQFYIVQRRLIVGIERQGVFEFGPRGFEVAAQHIRIAFVVEKPRGFAL